MKLVALLAATLVTTAALAPLPAAAQRHGHGWHTKKVCNWVGRGHHKVRRCRTVRVRW